MITFEAKPYVKVGGLGEVPPNLAVELARRGLEAVVVMPLHGAAVEPVEKASLKGRRILVASWQGVKYLLLGGEHLSKPGVYDPELMPAKVVEFARVLKDLLEHCETLGLRRPDVLHFHDWHSVYSLLQAKLTLGELGERAALVYHIHLLTMERVNESLLKEAGIDLSAEHTVTLGSKTLTVTVEEAVKMSKGLAERLGALESDVFVTVSESYLRMDKGCVLEALGYDLEPKGAVIYNGTDWRYERVLEEALSRHSARLGRAGKKPTRLELRRYLLLEALGLMPEGEPRVPDSSLERLLKDLYAPPFLPDGRVEPFRSDGPLVIMTGRVARQKGIDVLLDAIPLVLKRVGNAKFLFMLLPVWGGEEYFERLVETVRDYPDNVRVIFGIVPSVFKLAHVAADVFAAPSRWEPFGIMALESMASGTPVVASKVGGLREIVLDVRDHGASGTGLHVEPDDHYELAWALIDMLLVMEASNTGDRRLIDKIGDEKLRSLASEDLLLGAKVRESCIRRVETEFTWEKAAYRALSVYSRALGARS